MTRRNPWPVPAALAALSTVGLLSALIGDGPWDALSWVVLSAPLAVCLWYGVVRGR